MTLIREYIFIEIKHRETIEYEREMSADDNEEIVIDFETINYSETTRADSKLLKKNTLQ